MTNTLDIVGLCGSLREGSFNAKALRTAGGYLNGPATFEVLDWHLVPPSIQTSLSDMFRSLLSRFATGLLALTALLSQPPNTTSQFRAC